MFLRFFFLLWWDKMARKGWIWVFPFFPKEGWTHGLFPSPGQLGFSIFQQVKLSLSSFSWRQALLQRRVLWWIFSYCFPSSPCWKHEGIFLWYLPWDSGQAPGGKIHESVGVPLGLSHCGVLNSRICPHWTSSQLLFKA